MTRDERLESCKICLNHKFDPKQGIVCGLTDQPANFEGSCSDFKADEEKERSLRIGKEMSKEVQEKTNSSRVFLGLLLILGGIFVWVLSNGEVYAIGAVAVGFFYVFSN